MREKLLSIINEMLAESGNHTITQLENNLSLRDDLNMDSLMLAELTARIEDEYGVDLFEDGIVHNIGEVIARIEKG